MEQAIEAELRAAWERLSRRNRWTLVEDLEAFLPEAAADYDGLGASTAPKDRAGVAVQRAYNRLLHRLLVERAERAFAELYTRFYHMARRRDWQIADAQDIAAEATLLVMLHLHEVRSPEKFTGWTLNVYRSAEGKVMRPRKRELPLPTGSEGEERELAAPGDMAESVEHQVVHNELNEQLAAAVPNPRRRDILLRWAVFQETPRAIAAVYGVEPYIVRNEKHRAVADARKHEPLMRLLGDLAALYGIETRQRGGARDEP